MPLKNTKETTKATSSETRQNGHGLEASLTWDVSNEELITPIKISLDAWAQLKDKERATVNEQINLEKRNIEDAKMKSAIVEQENKLQRLREEQLVSCPQSSLFLH